MSCKDILDGFRVSEKRQSQNRDGHFKFHPRLTFYPQNADEIRRIVACAEAQKDPRKVRACGSQWSLNKSHATDDYLIETEKFSNPISVITRKNGAKISEYPLDEGKLGKDLFGLLHVEAGRKFRDVYYDAVKANAALPTQGGGAGGTTLAGITATGTHGSDFIRKPLADYIRAIHLIGPGGKSYWIEPSDSRRITDQRGWSNSDLGKEGIQPIYDDNLFDAVKVSVGRFGVIFSIVYEIIEPYQLVERRDREVWTNIKSVITKENTPPFPKFAWTNRDLKEKIEPKRDRFLQLDLSLGTWHDGKHRDSYCYVTRRAELEPDHKYKNAPKDRFAFAKGNEWELAGEVTKNLILFMKIAFKSPIEMAKLLSDTKNLPGLLNGLDSDTRREFLNIFIDEYLESHPKTYALGASWEIDGGLSKATVLPPGDSLEYVFDANDPKKYIEFVEYVLTISKSPQIIGWISIRYSEGTQALIGMHQFENSVAIEISMLKDITGNESFLKSVQAKAFDFHGVPHWGQMHDFDDKKTDISKYYGDNLVKWKKALREFTQRDGNPETFRNEFTDAAGLDV